MADNRKQETPKRQTSLKPWRWSTLAGRAIAFILLLGLIASVPGQFIALSPMIRIAISTSVVLLSVLGFAIVLLVRSQDKEIQNLFLERVLLHYKRLLYPPNYAQQTKDLAAAVIQRRLTTIGSRFSIGRIIGQFAGRLSVLLVLTFVFSISLVNLVSSSLGLGWELSKIVLFVIDASLRGLLFDVFEAYNLSIIPVENSIYAESLNFLIRTAISVFVLGSLVPAIRSYQFRRQYLRQLRRRGPKIQFFRTFEAKMRGWIATLPDRVLTPIGREDLVRLLEDVVIPHLWRHDGFVFNVGFSEAVLDVREAQSSAVARELIDLDVELLENWEIK